MKRLLLSTIYSLALLVTARAQVPVPAYTGTAYDPIGIIQYGGKMYYSANTPTSGIELWSYNGAGSPAMVADLFGSTGNGTVGIGFGRPKMAVFQNKLYFSGNNGSTGMEPYIYDGVNPPVLFDLRPGIWGSRPENFVAFGGKLYFTASSKIDSNQTSLYSYNGTGMPVEIHTVYENNPGYLFPYMGKLLFTAWTSAKGVELYSYDTLSNSVALVMDINPGTGSSLAQGFIEVGGKIYFTARDDSYGNELYSFNGTAVTRLTDVAPGGLSGANYTDIIHYNNAIYFAGANDGMSFQLYKYDLSAGAASLVQAIYPGQNAQPSEFVVFNGQLYFNATTNTYGSELWMTNGVTTSLFADLYTGSFNGLPYAFFVYNGDLYFSATNGAGQVLFRLSGPAAGITNTDFKGSLTVSPNPVSNTALLSLELPAAQKCGIVISDAIGRPVWEKSLTAFPAGRSGVSVSTQSLASGLYYYRLSSAAGITLVTGRFCKE